MFAYTLAAERLDCVVHTLSYGVDCKCEMLQFTRKINRRAVLYITSAEMTTNTNQVIRLGPFVMVNKSPVDPYQVLPPKKNKKQKKPNMLLQGWPHALTGTDKITVYTLYTYPHNSLVIAP